MAAAETTPRTFSVTLRVFADSWPGILVQLRKAAETVRSEPAKGYEHMFIDGDASRVIEVRKAKEASE